MKDKLAYADILSGPRNGYYINLQQGSVREGEVFHIVKRGGKEFHVYGEGDDKVWVEVGASKKKKAAETTPRHRVDHARHRHARLARRQPEQQHARRHRRHRRRAPLARQQSPTAA